MESMNKTDLISKITKQNENLKRYETRLRDVVTAYKGLVKEKEALEASLAALNSAATKDNSDDSVATLRLSLATLSAEKTRMEEAYQSDKKQAREQTDKIKTELQEQLTSLTQQRQLEVENVKARLEYEVQEREREKSSYQAILRELNTKLATERKSKERLEDKFSISTDNNVSNNEMEKRVRDLSSELEAAQRKLNRAQVRSMETPQMLVKLQEEITIMKQAHLAALREERVKAHQLEESSRLLAAAQEERVASLEARLADLSAAVALYHRQRSQDQSLIQQLKDAVISRDHRENTPSSQEDTLPPKLSSSETDAEKLADLSNLHNIIDDIHQLRKQLIVENERLGRPIDISSVFIGEDIHGACRMELINTKAEFEQYRRHSIQNNSNPTLQTKSNDYDIDRLKSHIKSLQEKIDILNRQMEEDTNEFAEKLKEKEEKYNNEKTHYKEEISDLKKRLCNTEKQLLLQKERYCELLNERDTDIRTKSDRMRRISDDESQKMKSVALSLQDVAAPPHMLHYAHEVARKDLDISQLRKDKHGLEGLLRDCQRDATIQKDRFIEIKRNLRDGIDRLRRIQSREGANLEYLKNVVLSYITSNGSQDRKHMLNAIAAVLHFTDSEKESVYKK